MVKAGDPTDAVIDELVPLLDQGDIVIDCGNAHFVDTRRRERELRSEQGLHFVGCGVSGGEEGALNGPSIMPGGFGRGVPEARARSSSRSRPRWTARRAACTSGPDGAGHFVKMVHNGIEYADMQLIAEAYDLLRAGLGAAPAEIAEIFRTWNEGDLESFLIEITADVLAHTDAATGKPFIDIVLDQAEQKGTGRWTVQSALDLGIPITGIAEATFARSLSGHADQRDAAREAFGSDLSPLAGRGPGRVHRGRAPGPVRLQGRRVRPGLRPDRGRQRRVRLGHRPRRDGHHLARRLHHPGPFPEPHPGGLRREPGPAQPAGGAVLRQRRVGRRGQLAPGGGRRGPGRRCPSPAFSSSLAYYDGLRRDRLPAALIQGLRDNFGAHTYRRVDRDGTFHTTWAGDRSESPA